jgi:flagellar basal body rod protein FlgG
MTSVSAIATSGMRAADTALRTSAHNLSNLETAGFRRERVVNTARAEGGVEASAMRSQAEGASIEEDLVAQLQAKNAFLANLAVFRAGSRATGSLLDVLA